MCKPSKYYNLVPLAAAMYLKKPQDQRALADDNYKIVKSHDGSRVLYDKDRPRVEIEIERIEEE